jgi:hypothetical protein
MLPKECGGAGPVGPADLRSGQLGSFESGYRHRLIDRARCQRVRFWVSEYILKELSDCRLPDYANEVPAEGRQTFPKAGWGL